MKVLCSLFLAAAALVQVQAADSTTAPAKTDVVRPAAKNIDVQEFEKLRRDTNNVVLDVRTPREYAAGHVPGAVNLDVNSPDFEKRISALDTNKTYLVHCAAGVRSTKACARLDKVNFKHLYNFNGGYNAWQKAGNKPQQ